MRCVDGALHIKTSVRLPSDPALSVLKTQTNAAESWQRSAAPLWKVKTGCPRIGYNLVCQKKLNKLSFLLLIIEKNAYIWLRSLIRNPDLVFFWKSTAPDWWYEMRTAVCFFRPWCVSLGVISVVVQIDFCRMVEYFGWCEGLFPASSSRDRVYTTSQYMKPLARSNPYNTLYI